MYNCKVLYIYIAHKAIEIGIIEDWSRQSPPSKESRARLVCELADG